MQGGSSPAARRATGQVSSSRRSAVPKNAVDSDKVAASLLADGLHAGRLRGRGRSGGGQHLRLRGGGPGRVDRDGAGPGRRPASRGPAGRHRLPGRAPRRGTGRRPARGRRRRRLRRRGFDLRGRPAPATQGRAPRPPGAAPAGAVGALGLRQGGRGLRPDLRLLRHPVVPGEAALTPARGHRSRGPRPWWRAAPGSSSWWPRTWPGTDATPASPGRWRPCSAGSTAWPRTASPGSGSSTSIRPRSATRWWRPCSSCRRSVPYFDLSLQHAAQPAPRRMQRWGSGERFPAIIEGIRRPASRPPPSARRSSSGSPARRRRTTRSCSPS